MDFDPSKFEAVEPAASAPSPDPSQYEVVSGGAAEAPPSPPDWHSLYGGLDGLDSRLTPAQSQAMSVLDRATGNPKEYRARAINQAFMQERLPKLGPEAYQTGWEATKRAYAKKELGIDQSPMTDTALYGAISGQLQIEETGEIKPWTWKDRILSNVGQFKKTQANTADRFWDSVNQPAVALPHAPADLPDVWMQTGNGMPLNPAIYGGVYNSVVKPILEGVESPFGIATLGVGSSLQAVSKTYPLARVALGSMSGLFAGLMGYETAKATPNAVKVLQDPNSTTQEKVEAVGAPVGTGLMAVMGAMGTAMEMFPREEVAPVLKKLDGATPAEAAEVFRTEAKKVEATDTVHAEALHDAARELEQVAAHAPEAPKEAAKTAGSEPSTAAKPSEMEKLIDEHTVEPAKVAEEVPPAPEPLLKPETKALFEQEIARHRGRGTPIDPQSASQYTDKGAELDNAPREAGARPREEAIAATNDGISHFAEHEFEEGYKTHRFVKTVAGEGVAVLKVTEIRKRDQPSAFKINSAYTKESARGKGYMTELIADADRTIGDQPLKPDYLNTDGMLATMQKAVGATKPKIEAAEGSPISIKNATVDEQLKGMGEEPATHGEKLTFKDAIAGAAKTLEEDPMAGQRLVKELGDNPRAVTGQEDALLLHELNRLRLERSNAEGAVIEAAKSKDPVKIADARNRVEQARADFIEASDVVTKVGTSTAQGLALRRMMMNEDYSLAAMEQRRTAANDGKPLTAQQFDEVRKAHEKIAETQAAFDEYRSRMSELLMDEEPTKRERTPGKSRAPTVATKWLSEKADAARARILERMKSGRTLSGFDPVDFGDHIIVAADYIAKGIDKLPQLTAQMIQDFGKWIEPHMHDIFEHAVETLEAAPRQRKIEAQQKRISERIEKLKTKIETGDLSPEARAVNRPAVEELETLKQERDALNKELADLRQEAKPAAEPKEKADPKESALKAYKTRTKASIADLERRIAESDFSKPERGNLALDDEALKLKAAHERAKQAFETMVEKSRLDAQPWWQKGATKVSDISRAAALSGYHTLAKLAGYSAAKFAEKPLTEAVGVLIKHTPGLKDIAGKANLEIGAEAAGIAKFYSKAAREGMRDAWQTMKTGKSDLKAELGNSKQNHQPVHWYDYFGISHMAEKAPLLRGSFELHYEKNIAHLIEQGVDVSDPLVQGAARKEAYEYSQRDILQENNKFSQWINQGHATLERIDPKMGEAQKSRVILSTLIKTFFTKGIVKTPANYIWQTLERSPGGLAYGVGKAALAKFRGIESLTPTEANTITRLLKVGAVGSAMFVWGLIDATKPEDQRMFGGYYQPGAKRKKEDVEFGKIRIMGHEFSHIWTHTPMTEVAQMGSTMMRVAKSKFRKRDKDEKGLVEGGMSALVSLASTAPVANPIMRMAESNKRGGARDWIGNLLAGLVPQLIANIAQDTDEKKRKATTPAEAIQAQIPVLREQLPERKGSGH